MTASACFRRMLSLEREAAAWLEGQGYVVFRFADSDFPGNIFASRNDHGLFITVVRVHRPLASVEELVTYYGKTISTFRSFPLPADFHFEIWVYAMTTANWQHYRVGPDEVTEVDHGR